MARKKKTRTKRGTQSNTKRLRNRRRVRRQSRLAGRKLEDWCAANLNCEERVSVGSAGRDPMTSHNWIMNRKKRERDKRIESVDKTINLEKAKSKSGKLVRFNKNFSIATFNIRSMNAPHKISELKNLMKNLQIDILFVQETKIIHYKDEPNIKETKLSDGTKYIHRSAIPGKNFEPHEEWLH